MKLFLSFLEGQMRMIKKSIWSIVGPNQGHYGGHILLIFVHYSAFDKAVNVSAYITLNYTMISEQ